jgi:hypothetical protein
MRRKYNQRSGKADKVFGEMENAKADFTGYVGNMQEMTGSLEFY